MRRHAILLVLAAAAAIAAVPAQAQPRSPAGNSLQFRFGWFVPTGDGSFWDDTADTFTLDGSDFDDAVFGVTFVTGVSNTLEVGFNIDFYDATVRSAYRDWIDESGFPILHDSGLDVTPVTVDIRFLPGGRLAYRGARGQYAVHHPVPYFGVGAGLLFWEYVEEGDFLDFTYDPPEVFPAYFEDDGVAPEIHALAGIEIPAGPAWSFLLEGRYSWADADLGQDFEGLGTLELGGFSGFFGVAFHF